MKWIAVMLVGLPSVCLAQTQPMDVTAIKGVCQPESGLTQGGQKTAYVCDNAVFAFFDQENSHIMIQFAQKGDDKALLLGFAGTMKDDGVTLDVDRIYLEPGKPLPADKASCKLSFEQPHITGIACNGEVPSAQASVLRVIFKADPGQ